MTVGRGRYCPDCGQRLLVAAPDHVNETAATDDIAALDPLDLDATAPALSALFPRGGIRRPSWVEEMMGAPSGEASSPTYVSADHDLAADGAAGPGGSAGSAGSMPAAVAAAPAVARLAAPSRSTAKSDTPAAMFAPTEALAPANLGRRQLATQLLARARGSEPLENATLPGDVAAAFLRRYDARPATQEAYARDLADWLVWLKRARVEPFDATLGTIESYAREPLTNGRAPAPATIARRLACLSHFYRRAHYAGLIKRNPVEAAQRPRVPERTGTLGVSKERAQDLIRVAREAGVRETLLVLLLLELGLRVSEACGADIEDVGEQGRHRVLAVRGKGQSTKASLVPLNDALLEAIAAATKGRTSGPLLMTSTGRRLTRQHAGKVIKKLGEQAGIPDLHPHVLRHAFITLSLDEGTSLRDTQDAARHADPRTTRRYDRNRNSLERHPTHRLVEVLEPVTDPAAEPAPKT
jgi:site-specific recombinase XerD